ncbi:MAG: alkaline phosphatase family protein [Clostridia bacterium]|nr:alkaline phosphatase family protein [Clostridia bacterium]
MKNVNMNKVILILTDGMHPNALNYVKKAQEFIADSASTMQGYSVMPSDTLPCHFSLFKSVDPKKHTITTNGYTAPEKDYRTICDVLCLNGLKSAMFYSWEQLKYLTRPNDIAYSCYINKDFYGNKDTVKKLTNSVVDFLDNDFASFVFLHYDLIDDIGHNFGWMSSEYTDAVSFVWDEIYKVLEHTDKNTTVIVISDHSGHDNDHGDEVDTLIPVMIRGKGFEKGSTLNDASIKDIAPTVTKILGINADDEWDGKSLL